MQQLKFLNQQYLTKNMAPETSVDSNESVNHLFIQSIKIDPLNEPTHLIETVLTMPDRTNYLR